MKSIKKLLVSFMVVSFFNIVSIVPDSFPRPVQEVVSEALEEAKSIYDEFYGDWEVSEADLTDDIAGDPDYFLILNDFYQHMFNNFVHDIEGVLEKISDELVNHSLPVREQAMNQVRAYTDFLIQQMSVVMNVGN